MLLAILMEIQLWLLIFKIKGFLEYIKEMVIYTHFQVMLQVLAQ